MRGPRAPALKAPALFASAPGRGGLTLLELLIVLGLVIGLAAIAWPSYQSMIERRRLKGDAERVRNALREARRQAMVEGVVYRWEYDPIAWNHRVARAVPRDPLAGAAGPSITAHSPTAEPTRVEPLLEESLSPGHRLVSLEEVERTKAAGSLDRPAALEDRTPLEPSPQAADDPAGTSAPAAPGVPEAHWRRGATLYPDGTAREMRLALMDEARRYVRIELDPLTGGVEISEVLEPREDETALGEPPREEATP